MQISELSLFITVQFITLVVSFKTMTMDKDELRTGMEFYKDDLSKDSKKEALVTQSEYDLLIERLTLKIKLCKDKLYLNLNELHHDAKTAN